MKHFLALFIVFNTFFALQTQAQPRRYVARTFYLDLITFQQAFGVGIYGSSDASNWGITYSPRANLIMLGNNSISLSCPLALGISGKGPGGAKITYDIPFVFDYNIGHNALQENTRGFGGFAGLGYGFSLLRADFGASKSNGIVFNAGARFLVSERSMTLRTSFMLPLKSSNTRVYSVGLQFNF
jgi:hypothetical protein